MMNVIAQGPNVLIAAGWLDLLPFVIAAGAYIIKIIVDASKQQQRQAQQRQMPRIERAAAQPPPMPRPAQAQPMQAGQPPRPKTPAEEVEEFLRRAAARKGGKQPQGAAPAPRQGQSKRQRKPVAPAKPRRAPDTEPVLVEVAEGPSLTGPRPTGSGVAKHVQQHLDESQFDQLATELSHLKKSVGGLADHVQHTFDHRVGTIAGESPAQIAPKTAEPAAVVMERESAGGRPLGQDFAAELAAMLRRPEDVRTAIIVSELMRRPEDRW